MSARERKLLVDGATACAACNASLSFWSYGVVDHCHWTGVVRGVVCVACNTRMRRSEEPRIKALGRYLEGVEDEKFDRAFEAKQEERAAKRAASIAESRQPKAERAYGDMIGAMLLDNDLLPKYRGVFRPEGDMERIYRALLKVYDSGAPVTASRVISALAWDEKRLAQLVVDIESAALTAESPACLAEMGWRTSHNL